MASPSTASRQPWEFTVVRNREIIAKLSACSPYASFVKDAPAVIVPCMREEAKLKDWVLIDLAIACESILLEADEPGLGATWCGIAPMEERITSVDAVLQLPANLHSFALIPIGHPAEEKPQPDRYDPSGIHFID